MNIISDKTIDYSTAKYWCIFSDPKFVEVFHTLEKKNQIKHEDNPEKADDEAGKEKNEEINEGIVDSAVRGLGYASYIFTGLSLVNLVSPFFKNMWRKSFKDGKMKIAEVKFEADEAKY
jgi:hypothetical protein